MQLSDWLFQILCNDYYKHRCGRYCTSPIRELTAVDVHLSFWTSATASPRIDTLSWGSEHTSNSAYCPWMLGTGTAPFVTTCPCQTQVPWSPTDLARRGSKTETAGGVSACRVCAATRIRRIQKCNDFKFQKHDITVKDFRDVSFQIANSRHISKYHLPFLRDIIRYKYNQYINRCTSSETNVHSPLQ